MTLNSCPFCGKTEIVVLDANEIDEYDQDSERWVPDPCYAAICDFNEGGCGATGGYRPTDLEAAAAWNQRS